MVSDDDYFILKLALLTEKVDEETVAMLKEINFEELSDQMDVVIEMVRSIQRNNFIDKAMAEKLFRIFLNGCRKYIDSNSDENFKIIPYMLCCLECVNYFCDIRIVDSLNLKDVFYDYSLKSIRTVHTIRNTSTGAGITCPVLNIINSIQDNRRMTTENKMWISENILGIDSTSMVLFKELKEISKFNEWVSEHP